MERYKHTTLKLSTSLRSDLLRILSFFGYNSDKTMPNPPKENPDTLLPWDDLLGSDTNRHNVRVICDLVSLTYQQKEVLTACVKVESDFRTRITHANYTITAANGVKHLSSTDYGIVQINDYWHIGVGKDFPSPEYVLDNPEACVRFMCNYYKANGHLNAWVSFTSGAYKDWLGKV